jgi:intracellular sulfur oxidation DsrE/DsrF family protein
LLALLLLVTPSAVLANPDRVIYHVNTSRPDVQWKAIGNLENLYLGAGDDQQIEVVMLLQGEAIDLISQVNQNRNLGLRLDELRQMGMRIEVGRGNYSEHRDQLATSNPPALVDNIFTRIIELQKQGYLYLAP